MVFICNGKTCKGYKNISYLEAQLGKNEFNYSNVPTLLIGYYDYRIKEYPMMKQWYFGHKNSKVYDIDFNNFFIRAFKEYLDKNNIKHQQLSRKLTYITDLLHNKRAELKSTYLICYKKKGTLKTVSDSYEFHGYGTEECSSRKLLREVKEITGGNHITYDCIEEIIDKLTEKYTGRFYVINRYHFYKYKYLAGIGWIKRFNEQLWWNIMKHASMKLKQTIEFVKSEGHAVYSCYIDSIQTDINILKKYPELFDYFPAKEDKTGKDYGLCLPPSYWIDKHTAMWMKIDYRYYFSNYICEKLDIFNSNLIYLKNFLERVHHPLKDYIMIDLQNKTIQTFKLDKMDYFEFSWDFQKKKTEWEKIPKLL